MANHQCPGCGSNKIEDANIDSAAIRLQRSSTLKKVFNTGGQISCRVCISCGAMFDLRGDPAALASMLPE